MTGGHSGIGSAMAYALGCGGAKIILAARREKKLQSAAQALREEGIIADYVVCDLSEAESAKECGRKLQPCLTARQHTTRRSK